MRGYRRGRVTPYSATTGASQASGGRRQPTPMRPTGYGGVGASPAFPLVPDAHGIAFVAPLWICRAPAAGGSGARNASRQGFSATC